MQLVYSDDFQFAVALGVLGGTRDFLHYEMWLKKRIADSGSPFLDVFLSWIEGNIIVPVQEFSRDN